MTDFFFQMGLSNACLSLALGIVAMVVGAKAKRPGLAHMLWLLVFIKLLTPPIVKIPIVTIPAPAETAVVINDHTQPIPLLSNNPQLNIEASQWSTLGSAVWNLARVWVPLIWLLGSVVVFAFSIVRVSRFSRLLSAKSEAAADELQTAAVEIAHSIGIEQNTNDSHYISKSFADGMVGRRKSANSHSKGIACPNGCSTVEMDFSARTGACKASRLYGAMARVAGLCLFLVESCGVVGAA